MTKKAKRGPASPIKSPERRVGRGKPPKHAQYKKGQTGNERGRPKGSKNLATIIMEAAHHPVIATIAGTKRTITTLVATAMQLGSKAAAGDSKSAAKFLDCVDKIESSAADARATPYPLSAPDLEVLNAGHDRIDLAEPA